MKSLFLFCCDCVLPEHKVFVEFKIPIKDKINNEDHMEKIGMYAYMCVCAHMCLPFSFTLCKFCLNFFLFFVFCFFVFFVFVFVFFLTEKHWFTTSSNEWGFSHFMPLEELLDASELLVNDTLIVEGEIIVISNVK